MCKILKLLCLVGDNTTVIPIYLYIQFKLIPTRTW